METRPFLMFEGKAEEAINLYISLIPNSRVENIKRYGADGPGPEGSIARADFTLGGRRFIATDSSVKHGFTFTPSISIFVDCETAEEVDRLAAKLSEGGQFLMPLGEYPFSPRFAWIADRFGVSWQINLPSR